MSSLEIRTALKAFVLSHAIFAADSLGLLDWLAARARSNEDIADWMRSRQLAERKVSCLMRLLRGSSVIIEKDNIVTLSPEWENQPFLRHYLRWKRHTVPYWSTCIDVLKGKEQAIYGEDIYSHLQRSPELFQLFHNAMDVLNAPALPELVDACVSALPNTQFHILDLGAGAATLTLALMSRFPNARCTCVDLDTRAATESAQNLKLSDRCKFVTADMFSTPAPAANIVVLSNVICDWNDEQASALVHKAAEALPANGLMIISEHLSDEASDSVDNLLSDFIIAMETNGAIRTMDELQNIVSTHFSVKHATLCQNGQTLLTCKRLPT